ncbi:hypothetical protein [Massilia sp. S19_KUP03_FR1]|uniref:hypothetical protein n=1 Tax=Massilia sp. S19_KUP03_FR1 TaxID=3025503 RepID=UPI002FCDB125
MFDSTVLEVALGLTFCFCSVSLIVSSVNEGISSFLKLRGKYLLGGLKTLLNDPTGSGLVLDLYNHARLNPGGSGRAPALEQLHGLPSYVEPRQFAVALIEVLQAAAGNPGTPGDLLAAIEHVPEGQLRDVLRNMYRRAGADAQRFETEVAYWFENAMDRLSGNYKRTMQWCALLVGFALAVLMNIDALHLFKVLWEHPALMRQIDTTQLLDAHSALNNLTATSLPIGWERPPFTYQGGVLGSNYHFSEFAQMAAGWAITASSTLFGSPFWFDMLQKITHLRGTGPKAA